MFKRADWIFSRNPDAAVGVDTSSSDDDGEIARDHPESSEDLSGTSDDLKRAQAEHGSGSASDAGGASAQSAEAAEPRSSGDASSSGSSDSGSDADDGDFDGRTLEELQEALAAADSGSDWEGDGGREEDGRRKKRRVYSDRKGLEAQRAEWLLAAPGTVVKGTPLRCTLCDGTLLLNSRVFQAHMASKRHRKAAERGGCGDAQAEQLERVVWAEAARPRGADGETHAERLVRMHQATTSARTAEGGNSVGNTPHSKRAGRQVRKREERRAKAQQPDADGSVKSKPKGKPGKRQRLAMREAAAAAKADTSAAEPKTKRTAKGATAGGAQQAAKGPLLVDAAEMAGKVKAGQVERQSRKRARRTSAVAAHG